MSIQTLSFGGNGGYKDFSPKSIQSIGFRSYRYVDQIIINDIKYGESGGEDRGSITLEHDEYINFARIRHGNYIDDARFETNKGRSIGSRVTTERGELTELKNIRVLAIGGNTGNYVDRLEIKYIKDYKPSTIVQENVGFILDYTAPFQKCVKSDELTQKSIYGYEMITRNMLNKNYGSSIKCEYYAKVAASINIEAREFELTNLKKELETKMTSMQCQTIEIPEGYVGIWVANGNLMKGSDGKHWMYPNAEPTYSIIKLTDIDNIRQHYDLKGTLSTQMHSLVTHRKVMNDFVYYK